MGAVMGDEDEMRDDGSFQGELLGRVAFSATLFLKGLGS